MGDFTFIYALCDPDTDMVRYVGKSDNPKKRYQFHLYDKKQWTPEFKEKRSLEAKEQWNNKTFREMQSQKTLAQWKNPSFKEKMHKLFQTPEFKKSFRRKKYGQCHNTRI